MLAAEPFEEPEDPPVCLAPSIPGDRRTGSRESEPEETDLDAPDERHQEVDPDGTRVPSVPERAASRVEPEVSEMRGVSAKKQQELDEAREQVVALLKERGPLSRGEIQAAIGDKRSGSGFAGFLREMKAGGAIDSRGTKALCRYFIKGDRADEKVALDRAFTRKVERQARRAPVPASGKAVDSNGTKYDAEQDPVQILQQRRDSHLEQAGRLDRAIAALLGQ